MYGISVSGTFNPPRSTISQPLRGNSGEKERMAINDDTLSYAKRANSALRSRGSCSLFIVTIINKPYAARMYIRIEDTLIIPTNQNNQAGRRKK
jgi:hypothetical protein